MENIIFADGVSYRVLEISPVCYQVHPVNDNFLITRSVESVKEHFSFLNSEEFVKNNIFSSPAGIQYIDNFSSIEPKRFNENISIAEYLSLPSLIDDLFDHQIDKKSNLVQPSNYYPSYNLDSNDLQSDVFNENFNLIQFINEGCAISAPEDYKKPKLNSKPKVSCPECNKTFTTTKHFNQHYREVHKNYQYQCSKCKRKFETEELKQKHEAIHLGYGKEHACEFCGRKYRHKQSKLRHQTTFHKQKRVRLYNCNSCGVSYIKLHKLESHIAREHNPNPIIRTYRKKKNVLTQQKS